MNTSKNKDFTSLLDVMENTLTEEERDKVEYWDALSDLIVESLSMRTEKDLSQDDVAKRMGTKQSVVSRFENMGRKPNYDFLVRYAKAIGGRLNISFEADYVYKIPRTLRETIDNYSKVNSIAKEDIIDQALEIGFQQIVECSRRKNEITQPSFEESTSSWNMVVGGATDLASYFNNPWPPSYDTGSSMSGCDEVVSHNLFREQKPKELIAAGGEY